jgi:type IV secretion system protein VirB3
MNESNEGLTADVLFVAATRPPTRWGVPYVAIMANLVVTMEVFLLVKNPLILLMALPAHGIAMLLCARDARFFDLAHLWVQTRLLGYWGNALGWRGGSYSPLTLDTPNAAGRRRAVPRVRV